VVEYGAVGAGTRIFVLVLLILVLVLGGLVSFDYLGLVDSRERLAPVLRLVGIGRAGGPPAAGETVLSAEELEDPFLLEKERLKKQTEALGLQAEELEKRDGEIRSKEQEIAQIMEQLQEKEKALEDREKMFNEQVKAFENRRVNLRQNSEYLVGMPPKNAVQILLNMDDLEIIDIFRITEEQARTTGELSLVSYWLSLMPADRAAALQRKMSQKAGG
jgi:flagellar protein FlbB